jgi:F5/8 type C domain
VEPGRPIGQNLALGKTATQSSTTANNTPASNAVDGNTDGRLAGNSLSHTQLDRYAWWQVDLGAVATVDSIRVWNRTDCCDLRLSDYWIFASDTPFTATDTPLTLQNKPGVWSTRQQQAPKPRADIPVGGAAGRYIRVQLAGASPIDTLPPGVSGPMGFLSLAEVQVFGSWGVQARRATLPSTPRQSPVLRFETDNAARLTLETETPGPVKVQYLFWPNNRLEFSVDGQRVEAPVEDGLQTVSMPKGHRLLEIRYKSWPLRIFLVLYVCYALSVLAVLIRLPMLLQLVRRRRYSV